MLVETAALYVVRALSYADSLLLLRLDPLLMLSLLLPWYLCLPLLLHLTLHLLLLALLLPLLPLPLFLPLGMQARSKAEVIPLSLLLHALTSKGPCLAFFSL